LNSKSFVYYADRLNVVKGGFSYSEEGFFKIFVAASASRLFGVTESFASAPIGRILD
jgi:hypothetical protein